ncbi:MAG: ATP-dependent helicase, partial [Desulfobacteraceae bacterium]
DDKAAPPLFSQSQAGFQLNKEQQAAVEYTRGPLLICAGPGTGKTRTITCKMAALIEKHALSAEKILAVTFTNKAAQEMRDRLGAMLPNHTQLPLVATFHGFCWKLLKEFYEGEAGAIVDEQGRRSIVGDAVEMAQSAGRTIALSTDALVEMIVQAKQQLLGPADNFPFVEKADHRSQLSEVYQRYQDLMTLQALYDFEDLLFRVVNVLVDDGALRKRVQKRFSYIFVDEFQDINDAQYRLLRALATPKANVCVIGDPDQAIYGFRGSDVRFFKQFVRDYKKTRVIQLARNYRSTETILSASFQVIKNHQFNIPVGQKTRIYSNISGTATVSVLEAPSPRSEAVAIGHAIEDMVGGMGFHSIDFDKLDRDSTESECGFGDFAVLCRTGDQVQSMIRQLISAGIPCQMVSRRFLQQSAVIKLLAAFRVLSLQGSYADISLLTDLIAPGISKETLTVFKQWAYARRLTLATAIYSVHRLPIPNMSTARQQRLVALVRLLNRLQQACGDLNVAETIIHLATATTLSSKIEKETLERLTELALPFGKDKRAFCAALAISRDTDLHLPGVEKVSVMTLHAAKGLEFPVVFLAGCEKNILPYRRSGKENIEWEEERRLFYVGMTRARRQLFLTWSRKRTIFGQTLTQQLSPFVNDIEEKLRSHVVSGVSTRKPKHEQLSLF